MAATEAGALAEEPFAALVEELAGSPDRVAELTELLHESHPLYDQRGSAATVRMRGWVLLALGRRGLPGAALLYVLEELDNGIDAYLVAAAARTLRTYATREPTFAPFLMRAIDNIRNRDDLLDLERYGEYGAGEDGTTAVQELLSTLSWLGAEAAGVLERLESLRSSAGLSSAQSKEVKRIIGAIRKSGAAAAPASDACCELPDGLGLRFWSRAQRRRLDGDGDVVFEDQAGRRVGFADFFRGQPSIVVFFYTRCANPRKCVLTVSRLARMQQLLAERGLGERVRTAAITYDPGFDSPPRLDGFGRDRGLRIDDGHRLLRAVEGFAQLRRQFRLGVSFVESIVGRHRIEVFVLDGGGRIAALFERIHWDERAVVERAASLLEEVDRPAAAPATSPRPAAETRPAPATRVALGILGPLAAAFFPKCAVCWTAYLSLFGIAGLERIPYSPWLLPLFCALTILNLFSLAARCRARRRTLPLYLAAAGAFAIIVLGIGLGLRAASFVGVALTLAGSLTSAFEPRLYRKESW